MPKKKFIDKKKAVSFHLVHRSQRDPLVADETAPQHVLLPVSGDKQSKSQPQDLDKRKEEQRKFGVFFDDNYDYLQHLRPAADSTCTEWERVEPAPHQTLEASTSKATTEDPSKLKLPSSVFASHVEEDVGLLNRAAPQSGLRLDLDPDIVAAMDEDFNFDDPDNQLEDDFMQLANASGEEMDGEGSDDDGSWTDDDSNAESMDQEDGDEVRSLNGPQFSFTGEETKSRFTEYSMSSSVMRRNNQLSLLDSRFEQMFAGYDDTEIGALDCDEIEGPVTADSQLVLQCAEEFEREKARVALGEVRLAGGTEALVVSESDSEDEMVGLSVAPRAREQWDCESVLTSRSNLYNHPKLIPAAPGKPKPIKISAKTGIPVGVLSQRRGLTAHALASLDAQNATVEGGEDDERSVAISAISTLSMRPKGESPEERLARKHALKEYRKERRVERKANKVAFKEEKKKQEKLIIHNRSCAKTVKIV